MRVKKTRDVVILVVFLLSLFGGIYAQDVQECDKNVIVREGEAVTTGGLGNTFVGKCTGTKNEGEKNTFIGCSAGFSNTIGSINTFLGYRAGYLNTSGIQNTFLGNGAGVFNKTGNNNIFIGKQAGYKNTTSSFNIFIGNTAGWNNNEGSNNTFLGWKSGYANTSGSNNTFLGLRTGTANTTGYDNTFVGYDAGNSNTKGGSNTFLGRDAGYSNTEGTENIFIGTQAGKLNVGGDNNIYIGNTAGHNNEGNDNVFIGHQAGYMMRTDISNTLIIGNGKYSRDVLIYGEFKSFGNGKVGINTTSPQYELHVKGTICADAFCEPSDIRQKTDVNPINSALDQISLLRGVTFHWKDKKKDNGQQMGVIAQEIEKVFPQVVSTDGSGYKSVAYSSLVAPLIEAVKELKSENETLKARLEALEKMIKK